MSEIRHPRKAHAWLPAEWDFDGKSEDGIGGPIPYDPLVVYVCDDNCELEDGCPVFWFSLRDMVIDGFNSGKPGDEGLRRIRDGLADLVKWIDSATSE